MSKIILNLILLVSLFHISHGKDFSDIKVEVKGMVCDFCARGVEKKLKKTNKIKEIKVDLDEGLVSVKLKKDAEIKDSKIRDIMKKNGLEVLKIVRNTKE